MADIKAIRRFLFNSRPVESTAADLNKTLACNNQTVCMLNEHVNGNSHHLSTSVSKIIPRSAWFARTAWVMAFIASLSSGLGIWFGNKPDPHKDLSSNPLIWKKRGGGGEGVRRVGGGVGCRCRGGGGCLDLNITIWLQELTSSGNSPKRFKHLFLISLRKKNHNYGINSECNKFIKKNQDATFQTPISHVYHQSVDISMLCDWWWHVMPMSRCHGFI